MWICQGGFATEDSTEMINGIGFAGGDLLERIYRNGFAGADPQVWIGVDWSGFAGENSRRALPEWIDGSGFAGADLLEPIGWRGFAGVDLPRKIRR